MTANDVDADPHFGAAAVTGAILDSGLIAILRAATAQHFPAIVHTLLDAGIRAIEITLTTPDALSAIASLSAEYDEAIIGAGTVVTADQAEACLDAGADFLVSPTASPDVIAAGQIAEVPVYPGAMTPSEMLAAMHAGASAIKLFPASAFSPRVITDIHGPFPDIPIMPTGGIAIDDIAAWIRAGAAAVGLGAPLIGVAAVEGSDRALAERARRALDTVTQARESR